MKKYKLLKNDTKTNVYGQTLFRIKSLIKTKYADIGDLGGYIQSEVNLSHEDDAWVSGNAWVYGSAQVFGDARVSGNAWVYGDAQVCGSAQVFGDARVSGNAQVCGSAQVFGDARVSGNARVSQYGECVVINNQKNTITLTPNLIIIGCKTWKTIEEFENTYKKIGKENNYTDDEIEMTGELVRSVMKRIGKPDVTTIKITHNDEEYEIDVAKAKELGIIK